MTLGYLWTKKSIQLHVFALLHPLQESCFLCQRIPAIGILGLNRGLTGSRVVCI